MISRVSAHHWIGGEWVVSKNRRNSINPAIGEIIVTYTNGTASEATQAITMARRSFLQTDWRENRRLRTKAINEMAGRLDPRTDDLVEILAPEKGKIVDESRFEVAMATPKLGLYAALALTEFSRAIEAEPGHYSSVYRETMRVAGIIAPWNSYQPPLLPEESATSEAGISTSFMMVRPVSRSIAP